MTETEPQGLENDRPDASGFRSFAMALTRDLIGELATARNVVPLVLMCVEGWRLDSSGFESSESDRRLKARLE